MTCPYCQTRPIPPYRGLGMYPVHCGEDACRLVRRHETNRAKWDREARVRDRKVKRVGAATCPYCPRPLAHRKDAQTCGSYACQAERNRAISAQRMRETYQPTFATPAPIVGHREPADTVERLYRQARAARLAEERRTGQRRYTITDGWGQRGGVTETARLAIGSLSE